MRKIISLLLLLAAILALAGCAETEVPETAGETAAATVAAERPDETAAETQQPDSNLVLDAIVEECGMPFKFHSPTNRDVYIVKFYEDYAKREVWTKYDADEEQGGLAWEIRGDQLTLSGEWSETFTIDLGTMEATSDKDGRVYHILKVDKVED